MAALVQPESEEGGGIEEGQAPTLCLSLTPGHTGGLRVPAALSTLGTPSLYGLLPFSPTAFRAQLRPS